MPSIPLGISLFSLISLYFVFQRLRFTTQSRAVKSVGDEIIKINDFCMEFLETYTYLTQNPSEVLDKKDVIALNILLRKIDLHFEYLANQVDNFPYGTVFDVVLSWIFNHLVPFSAFSKLNKNQAYLAITQNFFSNYQDKIRGDSILERGIVLFENNRLKEQTVSPFNTEKLDLIIDASNQLNNYLEKHITKIL